MERAVIRAMPADVDDPVIDDAAQVVPDGREHCRQHKAQFLHPACDHVPRLVVA
jgi:hypothetical protein